MPAGRRPYTARMPVDIDRRPIAWREAGPAGGHIVALLHGLWGSRTAWDPQLDALGEAGYHATAWDMPGYGESDPVDVLSFPQLADAAAGWLEEMGSSAHLVGASIGGMVALHLAVRHPSLVRSLTLADTCPAFALDGDSSVRAWLDERLAPLRAGRAPADLATEQIARLVSSAASDGARSAGVAAMSRVSATGLEAALHCLPTHDVEAQLADIRCPTLVIVGVHDAENPPAAARRLAARIAGSRLVVLDDCGALPNLEQPEAFNRLVLEHLATSP